MRTNLLICALLSGAACYADLFKLTDLTVTSQTQTTGKIFIGCTGIAPPNVGDKRLWTLVIHDGKTKTDKTLNVEGASDCSSGSLTLSFTPGGLGTLDAKKVGWTATFNNMLQASVITSKPAIHDHFKTGQRSCTQNMKLLYLADARSGKFCSVSF